MERPSSVVYDFSTPTWRQKLQSLIITFKISSQKIGFSTGSINRLISIYNAKKKMIFTTYLKYRDELHDTFQTFATSKQSIVTYNVKSSFVGCIVFFFHFNDVMCKQRMALLDSLLYKARHLHNRFEDGRKRIFNYEA